MEITIFSRLNQKTGQYEHNHIEDGFKSEPTIISECQRKNWKNAKWYFCFGRLYKGGVYR